MKESSPYSFNVGWYTPRMVNVQSPGKIVPCSVTLSPTFQPNSRSSPSPTSAAERSFRNACFWSSATWISG